MRRRLLNKANKEGGGISIEDTQACDVVFYNPDIDDLIIRRDEKDWQENETPVGIVVIPASHGVLKDGSGTVNHCGVMSIKFMNHSDPDNGTESTSENLYWGYCPANFTTTSDGLGRYDSSKGLLDYKHVVTTANKTSNTANGYSSSTSAYIPRQETAGGTTIRDRSPYAPSPYLGSDYMSGEYNESYGLKDGVVKTEANNALSDFKGIVNTTIIVDLSDDSWKSGIVANMNNVKGVYPAAQICARYKTIGTKALKDCTTEELRNGTGFWYLPAMGELGYIHPKIRDINATIRKLKGVYGVGAVYDTGGGHYIWSSTECDADNAYAAYSSTGGVYTQDKDYKTYCVVRAFMQLAPPITYEFVDMGLSVDWCTCNIGARSPEEYGYYFMWGDTTAYNSDCTPVGGGAAISFVLSKYLFYNNESSSMTKYSRSDNKTILESEDDAAHVHQRGKWRMPTEAEFQELLDACNTSWVKNYNGISGYTGTMFTLKSDPSKTIFFPASGYITYSDLSDRQVLGAFWSSSNYTNNTYNSYYLRCPNNGSKAYMTDGYRYWGMPIRAVRPKQ